MIRLLDFSSRLLRKNAFAQNSMIFCLFLAASCVVDAEDTVELTLEVQGSIAPRCQFSLSSNAIDQALSDKAGAAELPFSLDCNQFFRVEMQSLNGGLLHENSAMLIPSPGFTDFLPYDLVFSFAGVGSNHMLAFESEQIRGIPRSRNSGVIPFETNGMLRVSWVPGEKLFGGRYADTIEVRVSGF